MIKGDEAIINRQMNPVLPLVGILVFGAIWGMSEVALGGALGMVGFPYRAGLLTGLGMGILALAYAMSKNLFMLFGIGIVAALVNLLGVPLAHLTVMCKANSCIAVGIEAVSLGLVMVVLRKGGIFNRMAGGATAAILSSAGFYLIGTHVAPCQYLSSFMNTGAFVVKEGIVWATFAATFVPLGYSVGEKLALRPHFMEPGKSLAFYGTAAGVFAASLAISSFAILAGI